MMDHNLSWCACSGLQSSNHRHFVSHLAMASTKVKKGDGESDVVKETRVETVDFQSQAGQEGATKEPVQVVHQYHPSSGGPGGGIIGRAASSVARSIESAKETLTGKGSSNRPSHEA